MSNTIETNEIQRRTIPNTYRYSDLASKHGLETLPIFLSPNSLGEYRFGFVPVNPHDYFRVEELVALCSYARASHHRNIDMEDKTQSNGCAYLQSTVCPEAKPRV